MKQSFFFLSNLLGEKLKWLCVIGIYKYSICCGILLKRHTLQSWTRAYNRATVSKCLPFVSFFHHILGNTILSCNVEGRLVSLQRFLYQGHDFIHTTLLFFVSHHLLIKLKSVHQTMRDQTITPMTFLYEFFQLILWPWQPLESKLPLAQ